MHFNRCRHIETMHRWHEQWLFACFLCLQNMYHRLYIIIPWTVFLLTLYLVHFLITSFLVFSEISGTFLNGFALLIIGFVRWISSNSSNFNDYAYLVLKNLRTYINVKSSIKYYYNFLIFMFIKTLTLCVLFQNLQFVWRTLTLGEISFY